MAGNRCIWPDESQTVASGSGFLGMYLLLNAVFLATEGFINPANGQFRAILIVLVGVTVALSVWLTGKISQYTD